MNELLRELEAVVGLAERADQGCWRMWANELRSSPEDDADVDHSHIIASFAGARTHNLHFVQALVLLYRTHHAEIAEAVKDARRYRWLKKNDNAYLLAEDVIDDAMHNSAREVGE